MYIYVYAWQMIQAFISQMVGVTQLFWGKDKIHYTICYVSSFSCHFLIKTFVKGVRTSWTGWIKPLGEHLWKANLVILQFFCVKAPSVK